MASGGNEALARLKDKRYGLLLTDLMMEQGTGFEVLEWVLENAPGLPVVICSSYAKSENLPDDSVLSDHSETVAHRRPGTIRFESCLQPPVDREQELDFAESLASSATAPFALRDIHRARAILWTPTLSSP